MNNIVSLTQVFSSKMTIQEYVSLMRTCTEWNDVFKRCEHWQALMKYKPFFRPLVKRFITTVTWHGIQDSRQDRFLKYGYTKVTLAEHNVRILQKAVWHALASCKYYMIQEASYLRLKTDYKNFPSKDIKTLIETVKIIGKVFYMLHEALGPEIKPEVNPEEIIRKLSKKSDDEFPISINEKLKKWQKKSSEIEKMRPHFNILNDLIEKYQIFTVQDQGSLKIIPTNIEKIVTSLKILMCIAFWLYAEKSNVLEFPYVLLMRVLLSIIIIYFAITPPVRVTNYY